MDVIGILAGILLPIALEVGGALGIQAPAPDSSHISAPAPQHASLHAARKL